MQFDVAEVARQLPSGAASKLLAVLLVHPRLDLQEIESACGCSCDVVEQALQKLQLAYVVLQVSETKHLSVDERFPRKTFLINPEAIDLVRVFLQDCHAD